MSEIISVSDPGKELFLISEREKAARRIVLEKHVFRVLAAIGVVALLGQHSEILALSAVGAIADTLAWGADSMRLTLITADLKTLLNTRMSATADQSKQ